MIFIQWHSTVQWHTHLTIALANILWFVIRHSGPWYALRGPIFLFSESMKSIKLTGSSFLLLLNPLRFRKVYFFNARLNGSRKSISIAAFVVRLSSLEECVYVPINQLGFLRECGLYMFENWPIANPSQRKESSVYT